jgi:hypothetical protein
MRGIDQWAARALGVFGCVTAVLFASSLAEAAASAVVFAPTGTVYKAGEFMGFVFPSAAGAQVGLWNGIATETGRFLAVEAGIDVYGTDLLVARPAPVANAKIGLADEHGARPSVALGAYQVSTVPQSSADLVYLSFTKGLSAGRKPLGDLTLGGLGSFAPAQWTTAGCVPSCAFRGGFPFADSRWGLLAGWTPPPRGPFRFSVDVVTGTSLASGATALLAFEAVRDVHPFVLASLAVDRREELHPSDVFFFGIVFGAPPARPPSDASPHGEAIRGCPGGC